MSADASEPLDGGWQTDVRRTGDVVHRSPSPWSASVLDLLRHLEARGFAGGPRVVGTGFDDAGNETVSFVDGRSLQPYPWTDEAIAQLGALLGELHRAARSFQPSDDAVWQDWFGRTLGDPATGFGHGDLGPWNIMAINGSPSGFIDWDTAGPMDPVWELAQAAWLNAQLHDDDLAERLGLGDARARANQVRLFLDGYGLDSRSRDGFVDKMVEVAVHDAANEAIAHNVTPETTDGAAANGYPFTWGMAWRLRGASWMLRHRSLLEAVID